MLASTNPLDVRLAFAIAKIRGTIFPEIAEREKNEVVQDAYQIGRNDYKIGRFDGPIFFNDEAELWHAWQTGNDHAQEEAEMRNCSHCSMHG